MNTQPAGPRRAALTGTIVPLVTPFAASGSFDVPAMGNLIEFVCDQGADGLMPTALTGEGTLLVESETLSVWDAVRQQTSGRKPIIPAVISPTTRRAIDLTRKAEQMGMTAVMVAPVLPELYAGRSHDDVYAFYADVASAMSLPIILFNYPSLTGIDFDRVLVERLLEIDSIQYIKESTGDTRRVHALQRLAGNRLHVICGAPNVALESLALGCRTWITGIMNAVPLSAQQLVRAVAEPTDLVLARRIYHEQILPLVDVMAGNSNPTGTIKAAIRARGVDVGIPRRPGSDVDSAGAARIARLMCDIVQAEATIQKRAVADRHCAGMEPSRHPNQRGRTHHDC